MILVYLIFFVLTVIAALAVLMYFIAAKINFVLDTTEENISLTTYWLYPFLKAKVFIKGQTPFIEVFVFGIKMYAKAVKPQKGHPKKASPVKDIKLENINLTAQYGFKDKLATGIATAILSLASQFIDIEHTPDFSAQEDYIRINAGGEMKLFPAIIRLADF